MSNEAVERAALQKRIEELSLANERLSSQVNEEAHNNALLRERINDLLQQLYGRKSERFENPNQLSILNLIEWPEAPKEPEETSRDVERIEYTRKRRKDRGPKPLPEHLPRIVVPLDPPEGERVCLCCSKDMERVDEVVTEELDIVPQQFRVKQYVQGKYRCRECMNRDLVKELPPRPIEKGRPSPTLLAYLVVSKYVDHLPLYRQEQIFKRYSIHLPRSTMDEWFGQLSWLLLPIVNAMQRRFLSRSYLQCDETPIDILDHEFRGKKKGKNGKKQIKKGYLWAYSIPDAEVIYDVTASRSARGPKMMLEGFKGHLQVDGYVGYDELFRSGRMVRVACLAHMRRKFYESRHAAPERVEEILTLIRSLYAIEAESRENGLEPEARQRLRDEKARPIFEALKSAIDELAPIPTPKSKLGNAVTYAQGQWPHMEHYLEDGALEIDNNGSERGIRPTVLGRKNYLFLGSLEGGGRRAKAFYSLVQSCLRLEIDPFAYLCDVIARVATHPQSAIDDLTPLGWKKAHEASENTSA